MSLVIKLGRSVLSGVKLVDPDAFLPTKFGTVLRGGDLDWTVVIVDCEMDPGGLTQQGLVIAEEGRPIKPWLSAPDLYWPTDWKIIDE